jgi:isoleucyl-tRNA synthetase
VCSYVPGWDCHGLPIELKAMEFYTENDLSKLNPIEIRKRAHDYALQQIEIQKREFIRWGIMGDWDHPYRTLGSLSFFIIS